MTTFVLLRHAQSTANEDGILAGRLPGIELSQSGKRQSLAIPRVLSEMSLDRIFSSPLERCLETIRPSSQTMRKRVHLLPGLIEMDYGQWSGEKLKDLRKQKGWKEVQSKPSRFVFPKGESFSHAATRVERELARLSRRFPSEKILIVTHGDIIKIATQLTLGMKFDDFQRIIIDPCSVTVLDWNKKQRIAVNVNIPLVKTKSRVSSKLKSRRVLGGGSGV